MKKEINLPEKIKVVVDTNIFISALLKSKNCLKIYTAFERDEFDLILSANLYEEYLNVFSRKKFKGIFKDETLQSLLNAFDELAHFVEHPDMKLDICRDPKDNILLECAVTGKADFIVTGDKDLLILKKINNISIITPAQFSDYL